MLLLNTHERQKNKWREKYSLTDISKLLIRRKKHSITTVEHRLLFINLHLVLCQWIFYLTNRSKYSRLNGSYSINRLFSLSKNMILIKLLVVDSRKTIIVCSINNLKNLTINIIIFFHWVLFDIIRTQQRYW
jgi:hypothetical protein